MGIFLKSTIVCNDTTTMAASTSRLSEKRERWQLKKAEACVDDMNHRIMFLESDMWDIVKLVVSPPYGEALKRYSNSIGLCGLMASLTRSTYSLVSEPWLADKVGECRIQSLPTKTFTTPTYENDYEYAEDFADRVKQFHRKVCDFSKLMRSNQLQIKRYQNSSDYHKLLNLIKVVLLIDANARAVNKHVLLLVKPADNGFEPPPQAPLNSSSSSSSSYEESEDDETTEEDETSEEASSPPESKVPSSINTQGAVDAQELKKRLDDLIQRRKITRRLRRCTLTKPPQMEAPPKDDIGDLFEEEDATTTANKHIEWLNQVHPV